MKKYFLFIVIVALTVSDCAGVPKQNLKNSLQVNQIENEYFSLILTPKCTDNLIVGFDLTIRNKTNKDIEIDWDKTLFIDDSQTNGRFWYKGVSYTGRYNSRPPDIVFAKSTLKRTIWPTNLIEFRRGKCNHIPMDAGEHGIYLRTRINGNEINEKVTFDFSAVK